MITKENILDQVDSYELINFYLRPFHQKSLLKEGEHISNPLLSQKQKTPSFNIYRNSNNYWRYKDFATNDEGDVFDLVQKLNNIDFKTSIEIICKDFNINDIEGKELPFISYNQWNEQNLSFWNEYGITENILIDYDIKPINCIHLKDKRGNISIKQFGSDMLCYAYLINKHSIKTYQPLATKYKFMWHGTKPNDYVFGYSKLPDFAKRIIITAGEKDVLSLVSHNEHAICLNSENSKPPSWLIPDLKKRFKQVCVLYDLDNTGKRESKKLCDKYGLTEITLPQKLLDQDGKDVSDFFALGYNLHDDCSFSSPSTEVDQIKSVNLQKIRRSQKYLTERKAQIIKKTSPILTLNGSPLIFPRTINIIQGKAGVHKSRLAEAICSTLIQKHKNTIANRIGIESTASYRPSVYYVDTERNWSEQFPYALQQILKNAGYKKEENPEQFNFISLLDIPRSERFASLNEYLEDVRLKVSGKDHLVIILDVVTDCIKDFNRSEDSMQLIDLMNESINTYDVTFIGLIHENPGSADKARGHLGTELMNKSSTVLQISFENGANNQPSDLICLKALKSRSTKKIEPLFLKYCEKTHGLITASTKDIQATIDSRSIKAEIEDVILFLSKELKEPLASKQLLSLLTDEFGCSQKIARERLKKLIEGKHWITNQYHQKCVLFKYSKGNERIYKLQPEPKEEQLKID